jgi:hypothetical protein
LSLAAVTAQTSTAQVGKTDDGFGDGVGTLKEKCLCPKKLTSTVTPVSMAPAM